MSIAIAPEAKADLPKGDNYARPGLKMLDPALLAVNLPTSQATLLSIQVAWFDWSQHEGQRLWPGVLTLFDSSIVL